MTPDDPSRVEKLSWALRKLVEWDMDIPAVLAACASVGIERSQDTASMLVDYCEWKQARGG